MSGVSNKSCESSEINKTKKVKGTKKQSRATPEKSTIQKLESKLLNSYLMSRPIEHIKQKRQKVVSQN